MENQEGGAMYISCGDDGVAVEAEMGYVPNNPLFGLPLDSPQVKVEAATLKNINLFKVLKNCEKKKFYKVVTVGKDKLIVICFFFCKKRSVYLLAVAV